MKIVADGMIPLLEPFFADLGDIVKVDGRGLRAADVADADVLLVRSITQVDAALLAGSRVRFVGTATIGTDHVDRAWLAARSVGFANAPGCNAVAVAEYVMTVLALHAREQGRDLAGLRLGVVGLGQVGSRLAAMAAGCGLQVEACDPLLPAAAWPAGLRHRALDDLCGQVDALSLHVPLSTQGPAATLHLFGATRLARCRGLLVNTSRGPVVDNDALAGRLAAGGLAAALDVWEGEPAIDTRVLAACRLGTPHIAGHSREGKWRGTAMLSEACRAWLGLPPGPQLAQVVGGDGPVSLAWPGSLAALLDSLTGVSCDDAALRALAAGTEPLAAGFDRLRRERPERREFFNYRVEGQPDALAPALRALGFSGG